MRHPALKYLFEAVYAGGASYFQNDKDVSVIDGKKSCFYDVDLDRLESFVLRDDQGHVVSVSMLDGHFEIDGVKLHIDDTPYEKRRLIYFRRVDNVTTIGDDKKPIDQRTKHVATALGWQANDADGKNVKHIIFIE